MEISSLNCSECFVECAKCRPRFICNSLCTGSKMQTKWPVINYTLDLLIQSFSDVQVTHKCCRYSVKMVKLVVLLNLNTFLKGILFIIIIKGRGTTATKHSEQFSDEISIIYAWRKYAIFHALSQGENYSALVILDHGSSIYF